MGVVWYNGSASITDFSNKHERKKEGLKQGGKNGFGWGANASKVFRSRSFYLVENLPGKKIVFVLTYRTGVHPETKKHINAFLQWLKRRGMNGFTYVVELQERNENTVHYHFLVSAPQYFDPKQINDAWCRIRGDYSPNAVTGLTALRRNNKSGLLNYMQKGDLLAYMAKCSKLEFRPGKDKSEEQVKALRKIYEKKVEFLKNNVDRLWSTSRNLVGVEKVSFDDEQLKCLIIANSYKFRLYNPKEGVDIFTYELDRKETNKIYKLIIELNAAREKEERKKKEAQLKKIKENRLKRLQSGLW